MAEVEDVQAYLAAQGLVDDGTWPSSRRKRHDGSDRLVVISEDGGVRQEIPTAQGIGSQAMRDPAVQVAVRGPPGDGDGPAARAQAIYDALHGKFRITMGGTEYLRVVAQSPRPVPAGWDGNDRHTQTVSVRMTSDV